MYENTHKHVYETGEKPGRGLYLCAKCDERIRLDQDSDRLPPCPRCNGTKWYKVS